MTRAHRYAKFDSSKQC